MSDPASAARPEALEALEAIDRLDVDISLQHARAYLTGFEQAHFAHHLQAIRAASLNGEQAIELECLQIMAMSMQADANPNELLLKARELLGMGQARGALLAQAAAWRAIQWVQTRLKLHHAALESVAMAGELYQRSGHPALAMLMQVSRCPVLFMAEMYAELRQASTDLLQEGAALSPAMHQLLLNNKASAAYYLANEESDALLAKVYWQECLTTHQQGLLFTQQHGLAYAELVAHLNLAVVNATLGRSADCHRHLGLLHEQCQGQPMQASWQLWERVSRVLLQCHEGSREQAWHALLALDGELTNGPPHSSGHRDATLQAMRVFGERWGYLDQALRASLMQLKQERSRKRELARALGETVNAVIERPRLLQENEQLTQHGTELELSLAQRNQELSLALAKVQAEASVRAAAETALQQAHDELEQRVRQRTDELGQAMRALMQQEKQLALSRMVAGMAHEMNTPLGNARMAASAIQERSQELADQTAQGSLKRSQLQQLLAGLSEGGALMDRALERVGDLVQRFKALDQPSSPEARSDFDLVTVVESLRANWNNQLQQSGAKLRLELPDALTLHGHPHALFQVLQQLFENSLRHGLAGRRDGNMWLTVHIDGQQLALQWQDDGCGIPPDHLPRVFEPFFSTRLGQDGAGLGLTMLHSLVVDLMGGQINVSSPAPGLSGHGGTRFELMLPI
ncbi:HAMP domain-containing histidine kinase [Paucibacter sp. B2R-40]|uniref:sensor histidine kinase n=1 Tax=Paucibacter sp. B2R-40 TaxID=2893554 RepID=UPI0021E3B7E0|nr:HAMP domain-containing sensor histidine kinase [Paucibacter sp. B2R-40]MCV2356253.1 HAMP domain-containing histidine kinase [Paucibacter sp. B2R-40]